MGRPSRAHSRRTKPILNEKVVCSHCGKRLHPRTVERHLAGATVPQIPESQHPHSNLFEDPYSKDPDVMMLDDSRSDEGDQVEERTSRENTNDLHVPEIDFVHPLSEDSIESRRWSPSVEDVPDEDEDDLNPDPEGDQLLDLENGVDWAQEMDDTDLVLDFNTGLNFDRGLSLDDLLDEQLEQELAEAGQFLTDDELAAMRHFALKVETHMTDDTFAKLPFACPSENFSSWKSTKSRAHALAGFTPKVYHCCMNSCICYVGPHAEKTQCPYCQESRYRADGKTPRKRFTYLPITP
ncbi:hypothetical protein EV361DRAFT_487717 [Lentinula raphanica]|nr:hypothetical protein EV361DRAFT_487717 [Lentinula raphanica]